MNMNQYQQLKSGNAGMSLMEIILTLAITAIILTAIVSLTSLSVSTSTLSKNKAQANRYAGEAIEFVRTEKGSLGWNAFKSKVTWQDEATGIHDVWCLKDLSFSDSNKKICNTDGTDNITGTIFRRSLEIKNVTNKTMDIEVKVIWTDEKGTHETFTISAISNW